MALDMTKFLARFIEEARDHIGRLNEGLVRLENHPEDHETVNAVFRSVHTLKGSSRMMKFGPVTELAHKMEDALSGVREKRIAYTRDLADVLFKGLDCISAMIEQVAAGNEISVDATGLCAELARAAEGPVPGGKEKIPVDASADRAEQSRDEAERPSHAAHEPQQRDEDLPGQVQRVRTADTIRVGTDRLDELVRLMGEIISNQNRLKHRLSDIKEAEKLAKRNAELLAISENDGGSGRIPEAIEVGRSLHSKLTWLLSCMRDDNNMLDLLTTELQEKALMLRMVPLSAVFDPLQRMVRDLARSQGKDVELAITGEDIGLDKKMMEKLSDPLVHMLRNAVDHGIESPGQRQSAGKPGQGHVKLSASYDAGSVLIELSDDGEGLQLGKIREKAIRKKMFTEEELDAMSEAELVDLIFLPGFSTSPIITDLSGRGVGMDVVRRNIVEELKGSINIVSREGRGTVISVRLPMSLAVMRVIMVEASGMTFAVIAHYVSEIIRVPASEIITVLKSRSAISLREELIPVARLETLLGLPAVSGAGADNPLLLITRVGSEKLGLMVDALLDEEDSVIKALPAHMKNIRLVSGVTISGRNEIINILHIPGLIRAAADLRETPGAESSREAAARLLVVDDSVNTREIEKSILEAYGYVVDIAEDGVEAFEKAQSINYDLIITDVEMPRLDGFSLTERLRNNEAYKHTPIIIITSREKEEDKQRGIRVGANAYIVKGDFNQTNLLETVQNLIE